MERLRVCNCHGLSILAHGSLDFDRFAFFCHMGVVTAFDMNKTRYKIARPIDYCTKIISQDFNEYNLEVILSLLKIKKILLTLEGHYWLLSY